MDPQRDDRPSLLLVDDDEIFASVLARALSRRGYQVRIANSVDGALTALDSDPPEYAVVDLKLPDDSGLAIVPALKAADANTRIVILTGYASIATAVEAIKLGANYYLTKPTDADAVTAALQRTEGDPRVALSDTPLSVQRLEWEHINRVLMEQNGNVSAAARVLGMHRRTLQRKLNKRPVRR